MYSITFKLFYSVGRKLNGWRSATGDRPFVALGRRQLLCRLSRGSAEQLTRAERPVNWSSTQRYTDRHSDQWLTLRTLYRPIENSVRGASPEGRGWGSKVEVWGPRGPWAEPRPVGVWARRSRKHDINLALRTTLQNHRPEPRPFGYGQ